MAALPEGRLRCDPEGAKRSDEAGAFRERPASIDMKDLYDGYAAGFCTVDQSLLAIDIGGGELIIPIIAMPEGFLGVDDEKNGIMIGHFLLLRD
jgi:hypothetical protein